MRFEGFPEEAVGFFDELELNNTKDWFHANKGVYERACREPMKALVAELEPTSGEGKLFRPNRDIRFSKDKSPYKTNIAAVVGGYYVSLSADGLYAGGGVYRPGAEALSRFRKAVADDVSGPELEGIVETLERKGYAVESHDVLKTAPKGYPRDHERIELLRRKDLVAGKGWPPEPWLETAETLDRIRTVFTALGPMRDWLERHVL